MGKILIKNIYIFIYKLKQTMDLHRELHQSIGD